MDPLTILASLNPLDWLLKPATDILDTVNLLILGFKIVVLLFIVQFVRGRFGGGPIVTILILVLGYVMLFSNLAPIFTTAMFIYLFIIFGFSMLVVDLVIAKPWAGGGGEEEGGHMTGKQYAEALEKRKSIGGRMR
jgi:hypothetical protein